jgi:ABC-type multidrug transport system ATPase subunit
MDECEALCSRVGLLINGRLKCIGTPEHIKKRYGAGLSLTIKCEKNVAQSGGDGATSSATNQDRIEKFIMKRFKNATLKGNLKKKRKSYIEINE